MVPPGVWEMPYTMNGRTVELAITSVTGHLLGVEFEKAYRMWNSCNPGQLLDTQVMIPHH